MMLNKNNSKDTDDWDQIKNWVGAANKDTKHPVQQELDRMQGQQPQGMADGGLVDSMPAFPPIEEDPIVPRGTIINGPASLPIQTDAISMPSPEKPYVDKASSILGGQNPAKISQLLEDIRRQSNKSQIGAAFAGLGDAIASVGGQNPGHLKAAEDAIRENRDFRLKSPELMAAVGKENYGLSKQLQAEDPNSPFSKVKQNASRSLLKSLGFSDSDISLIPASSIDGLQSGALSRDEVRQRIASDQELKKIGFGIQQQQVEAMKAKNVTDASEAERKSKMDAAKDVLANSKKARFFGVPIPFSSDVSSDDKEAAIKTLTDAMQGESPQTVRFQDSTGQMHDIPAENLEKARKRDPGLKVIQ